MSANIPNASPPPSGWKTEGDSKIVFYHNDKELKSISCKILENSEKNKNPHWTERLGLTSRITVKDSQDNPIVVRVWNHAFGQVLGLGGMREKIGKEIQKETNFVKENEDCFNQIKSQLSTHKVVSSTITNILNALSSREFLSGSKHIVGEGNSFTINVVPGENATVTIHFKDKYKNNQSIQVIFDGKELSFPPQVDPDATRIDADVRMGGTGLMPGVSAKDKAEK